MSLDARIGMLNGGRYYCYPNGYAQAEFIGSLAEVEEVLDLVSARLPTHFAPSRLDRIRRYQVTVTPRCVAYAGAWRADEYAVEDHARSHADAITAVRRQWNEQEGRYGVRASFRAKVID